MTSLIIFEPCKDAADELDMWSNGATTNTRDHITLQPGNHGNLVTNQLQPTLQPGPRSNGNQTTLQTGYHGNETTLQPGNHGNRITLQPGATTNTKLMSVPGARSNGNIVRRISRQIKEIPVLFHHSKLEESIQEEPNPFSMFDLGYLGYEGRKEGRRGTC